MEKLIKKKFGRKEKKEKENIQENLDKGLWEFLEDMRKECGKKEKGKSYRVEEDIQGEIDSFCNRYSVGNREEEMRQVERKKEVKKKEGPTVEAIMPRKQIARRRGKSRYWNR